VADQPCISENLDKAALLLLGPAVEPGFAADGDPAIFVEGVRQVGGRVVRFGVGDGGRRGG